MKKARLVSLGVLALMIFASVDLGLNYFNAAFTDLHDGIVCSSVFRVFFGDSTWSLRGFFDIFCISLWITFFVAIENIALACIKISQER